MFLIKKKKKKAVVINFGRGTVKSLLFSWQGKGEQENIVIENYYENKIKRFGVFDGQDFEVDVIEKAFKKIKENNEKLIDFEKTDKIISFSPNILKAEMFYVNHLRQGGKEISEEEEKEIKIFSLESAERKCLSENDAGKIKIVRKKIISESINGYKTKKLAGANGKNVIVGVLACYTLSHYYDFINLLLSKLKIENNYFILHEVEGLINFILSNSEIVPALFINIGEYESEAVFFDQENNVKIIKELRFGGYDFTKAIMDKLGVSLTEAERLKEDFSLTRLSREGTKKIREIVSPVSNKWLELFEKEIKKEISIFGGFPYPVYLFGGGSLFPLFSEKLKENNIEANIFPASYLNFINKTKNKLGPREVSSILLALAEKKYEKENH